MKISNIGGKLSLHKEEGLSVFFLGVGSAFSRLHNNTNFLVLKGNDHLLVDCGVSCKDALREYGLELLDIENFFISHSHSDHTGSLEEVAFLNRYVKQRKPNIIITDEYKKKLWNETLKGGLAYSTEKNRKIMTFDDYFTQVKPVKIKSAPRPVYQSQMGSIDVKIFRTLHVPENESNWKKSMISYGILLDERVLFTLDSKFDSELLSIMLEDYPHIEYIFHDCQFSSGDVHAWYEELKTLPPEIKKIMYLCHYSDDYNAKNPEKDGFAGFVQQGVFYNFDE